MRYWASLSFFLFSIAAPGSPEWIQDEDLSYSLTAPIGWVLDRAMAAQAEADLVLYPQGTSYSKADSIITLSIWRKDDLFIGVEDMADRDAREAKRANPQLAVHPGPLLHTRLQRSVPLYLYTGLKDGDAEGVAYLLDGDHVMVFVLSCPNPAVLHEDLPALKETVASYEDLGGPQER